MKLLSVLATVMEHLTKQEQKSFSKIDYRQAKHADIINECTRLFSRDTMWIRVMAKNKKLVKMFCLDPLIQATEFNYRKIGVNMGALIMMKVPAVELTDVVTTDFAMEKIGQWLIKFLVD